MTWVRVMIWYFGMDMDMGMDMNMGMSVGIWSHMGYDWPELGFFANKSSHDELRYDCPKRLPLLCSSFSCSS